MDMVFVYEDKIARDTNGNYYVGSAFSQKVFDRYLQHFDHIILLMREAEVAPDDTVALSRMNRINTERIDVVLLPNPTASIRHYLNPRVHAAFKSIVLNEIKPDRAVIVRVPSTSGTIAADYCHKHGIPFLAEAIGCPWDSLWNHSLRGKLLAPASWLDMRRVMRHAPYSVYVTSEFLQHRYPCSGITASISDVELRPLDPSVLDARIQRIRNHSGRLKIATSGALIAVKGQKYVIQAIAKLKAQGNDGFEYHLAGSGDDETLRKLAKELYVEDLVVFEGRLAHEKVFPWLDEMDLYIQPSLTEGMPRALIEAMSRGLPALGSGTGGIPELLGEDCIFSRKGVDALARLLPTITPEKMERMAARNFERAKEYQKETLDLLRFDFYSAFANAAAGEKQ